MNPAARFHALIATLTVSIMFWAITYAVPMLLAYANPTLFANRNINRLIGAAFAIAGSVGIYKLLASGLKWVLNRSLIVRRWIFGASFMHGTWVGFFKGHAGDKRFTVEQFSQDFDGLVINGRSYTSERDLHGMWTSEATSIDARRGVLIFTYSMVVVARGVTLQGVSTFHFTRTAEYKPPIGIGGYAHDLNDRQLIEVHTLKESDALLPWDQGLALAVKRFP